MVLPVKNTCTPASVFGGITQTLFLGCSVVSFDAGAGWGEQKSELTVQLIQDPCGGSKEYYDRSLNQQTWTGADPGFIGEENNIVGAPVYFRVGDFEFSGLISDWSKTDIRSLNTGLPVKSMINNNAYVVKIEDPRELLAATQVVINEYAGFTTGLDNIVNAYGFMEALSANCGPLAQGVDGTIFGSPAAGFGGSDVDSNGMPWNNIRAGAEVLLSGSSTVGALGGVFSTGYIAFKGTSNTGYSGVTGLTSGMGLLDENATNEAHYVVDFSEVPTLPAQIRMNGVASSLQELISQVTGISGHDYYVELVPVDATGASWTNTVVDSQDIVKIIKIRTSDRDAQPLFGAIEEFITITDAVGSGTIKNQVGRELRNEKTQQLIVGGEKQNIYETENGVGPGNEVVLPYFGLDSDGNVIVPTRDASGNWQFEADITNLNIQLADYGLAMGVSSVTITERELRAALGGMEIWVGASAMKVATDLYTAFGSDGYGKGKIRLDMLQALTGIPVDEIQATDIVNLGGAQFKAGDVDDDKLRWALQKVFDFVHNYATEFYGKKFQVLVPNSCGYIATSQDAAFVGWGGEIQTSEEPSDGGWTELSTVIGITNPSVAADYFRHEDGRFMNFVRFDSADKTDFASLNPDEFVVDAVNKDLWVKAQIEADFVYTNKYTLASPRAILTISGNVDDVEDEGEGKLIDWAPAIENSTEVAKAAMAEREKEALKKVGGRGVYGEYGYKSKMPIAAAVGIKSNALKYGPYGSSTVAGKANVVHEEGLVPWSYGSYSGMNTAGGLLSTEGITSMQVGEKGSLNIPGYPTVPIGAELLSASAANGFAGAGPFNGGGNNLYENRTLTVTGGSYGQYVSTTIGSWDGTYGPNITGVTTSVGVSGFTTTYTMRTYTPKFGRFAKYNADRLKAAGQNRLNASKEMRAFNRQRIKARSQSSQNLATFRKNNFGIRLNQDGSKESSTPHVVLVGSSNPWGTGTNFRRSNIADESAREMVTEFARYDTKAFMSWDGLIMPVSMDGDGGLPQYATPDAGCTSGHPRRAQPPMDKQGAAGGALDEYNPTIDIDYLNPFTNPAGKQRSQISTNRSDTTDRGHHIEIIGRQGSGTGDGPPASSMVMPIQGYVDNASQESGDYQDDYRMFATRGPILMQAWGYDLDGFPVPNKADTYANASTGTFTSSNLECKFLDDHLRQPQTWPVAPIDLRYDRDRAVWVSPPAYTLVHGILQEDLCPGGSALCHLTDNTTRYDCSGNPFDAAFYVDNLIGVTACSGDTIMADYDAEDCSYNIVNQPQKGVTFYDGTGCPTGATVGESSLTAYDVRHIVVGKGLDLVNNFAVDTGVDACCNPSSIVLNAGFTPSTGSGCLTGTLSANPGLMNAIEFHGGLHVEDGDNDCEIKIGAGLSITQNNTCISSGDVSASNLISNIELGAGLVADTGSDACSIVMGIDVNSAPIASGTGVAYVLGVDTDGCLVRVPIVDCSGA